MSKFTSGSPLPRAAAHSSWAKTEDRTTRTEKARETFLQRFENQVDPTGKLPPNERRRRAANARKAYFLTLAAKSASVRTGQVQR